MRRAVVRFVTGIILVAGLGQAGCGEDWGDNGGACLYDTEDGLICYEDASSECCAKIYGEFHKGVKCSALPNTRVEPPFLSGC
jgi:hypothetical protein